MSGSFHLAWVNRDGGELVFHVTGSLTVGRGPDNGIVVDEEGVSRRHVELTARADGLAVRDLGSTNGTFLNGSRVQEAVLRAGDSLLVGRSVFRLKGGAPEQDRTATLSLGAATIEVALEAARAEYPAAVPVARAEDHLRFLCGLIDTITTNAGSEDSLLKQALDSMLATLDLDHGAVLAARDATRAPLVEATRPGAARPAPPISRTVVSRVLASGEAILFDRTNEGVDPALGKAKSLAAGPGSRVLCVPIARGATVLGALWLAAGATRRPLGEADLRLAAVAGRALALAADNVRSRERVVAENRQLRGDDADAQIAGTSRAFTDVLATARKAAAGDATILLTGETGTGKELVARAIHAASPRRAGPFIAINCGALPATVVESELFGHEKGAFTGALERRLGKFELADKGTLFLDEIGELPLDMQAKLLRVLAGDEPRFFRVGGSTEVAPDVRVVAATNKDLEAAVRDGAFREDLLYRVRVLEIAIPPLRERPEDIAPIASHLLARFARLSRTGGRGALRLSDAARAKLEAYAWPGNVRELRNVLERAVLLSSSGASDTIEADDVVLGRPGAATGAFERRSGRPLESLRDLEREHIRAVLEAVDWNKTKAAEVLGIGRTNIYEKIKIYGLEPTT
jgi:Nif-specific regulatory protein